MRRDFQEVGEGFLAVLDLLDENWGQWQRDEKTGKLQFHDTRVGDAYHALLTRIQNTSAEATAIQAEMASHATLPK